VCMSGNSVENFQAVQAHLLNLLNKIFNMRTKYIICVRLHIILRYNSSLLSRPKPRLFLFELESVLKYAAVSTLTI
jgi:hypothetical protein